jgi:Tfp pilus assembly protein PilF
LLARDVADLAAAERYGRLAVEQWEACGDTPEVAGALSLLGVVAADRGDLDRAHRLYQRSLTAFRSAHDPFGEAHALWRLADIALDREEPGAALAFAQEAYRTHELLAHRRGMGQASVTAARSLLALAEPAAAEAVITMALGDLKAVGFAADLAQAYETAGWIALAQGQAAEARQWGQRSLEAGGTPRHTVDALCLVAHGEALTGSLAKARTTAEQAADLARALLYPAGLGRSLEALAAAAAAGGEEHEAALLRRAAGRAAVNGIIDVSLEDVAGRH